MNKYFKAKNFNLDLNKKIYVMGILNITPDSFSDGGMFNSLQSAINRAIEIEKAGADILDIGAQSTRPGFAKITPEEEKNRLFKVLPEILKRVNIPVSIDTFYPQIAKEAIDCGAHIINDVTGFKNTEMFKVAQASDCGIIIMHNGQKLELKMFFKKSLNKALSYGINKSRICFDPGIGFEKDYEENLYIIKHLSQYIVDDCAMLVGASRKRVIGAACLNPPFGERMPGTIAAHTAAILNGANIIRVHDVQEAVQAASMAKAILDSK